MFGEPVVFVDIETSGSNYKSGRIIEIAAIRVEDNEVTDVFKTLVNPGVRIPYWITELTGLTNRDVADAPSFEDIAYRLRQILDGAIFIAHNVRFDYSFIKNQLEACGHPYNPNLLCTVRLSRALYPQHKGHSLQKIIERHGIEVSERHRAFDDARALFDFLKLAYVEHGSNIFEAAVSKQMKTRTLPPHMQESGLDGITKKPGVYVFEDEAGAPVYVGKSVNMRARVMPHFAQDTRHIKEMKLSQNTYNVRTIETKSELEALLLESQMVKQLLPVYNKQLRRSSSQTILRKCINDDGYIVIELSNQDLGSLDSLEDIYGVYPNKSKAKAALEQHLRSFQLCSKLLNLERTKGACFLHQLGKCRGACAGKEPAGQYNTRVELALERSKLESWPYQTPIALQVSEERAIVVDKWVVLGHIEAGTDTPYLEGVTPNFDVDTYRILRSFLKTHANSGVIRPYPI